jgi:thioredoxin 1
MQELTQETFQKEVLQHKGTVVVDFYTTWCHPCKLLSPILEELSKEMKDVKFSKVNADEYGELAAQYDIRSVPTLYIFKNGKAVDTLMGVQQKEVLKKKIASFV